jgi:hypothetical protein
MSARVSEDGSFRKVTRRVVTASSAHASMVMSTTSPPLELSTPTSFPTFPYDPPYPIQVSLMQHIYDAIESSHQKVAIVESPTGTVSHIEAAS